MLRAEIPVHLNASTRGDVGDLTPPYRSVSMAHRYSIPHGNDAAAFIAVERHNFPSVFSCALIYLILRTSLVILLYRS